MSIMARRSSLFHVSLAARRLAGPLGRCRPTRRRTEGLFVTVPNPITSDAVERIKKQIDTRSSQRAETAARPSFSTSTRTASRPRPPSSGVCSDLTLLHSAACRARESSPSRSSTTSVSGTPVLPVLACQELVMSKDASIGQIAGEGIEPERGEYRDYFEKDPRGFALIRKMYDGGRAGRPRAEQADSTAPVRRSPRRGSAGEPRSRSSQCSRCPGRPSRPLHHARGPEHRPVPGQGGDDRRGRRTLQPPPVAHSRRSAPRADARSLSLGRSRAMWTARCASRSTA